MGSVFKAPHCTEAERLTITPDEYEVLIVKDGSTYRMYLGDGSTVGGVLYGGTDGADGADGATGAQGAQGDQGPAGTNGTNGTNGADGADGATGPAGADGVDGADGPQPHTDSSRGTAPHGSLSLSGPLITLSTANIQSQNIHVYVGGVRTSDFTETDLSSGQITLGYAPPSGAEIIVDYFTA